MNHYTLLLLHRNMWNLNIPLFRVWRCVSQNMGIKTENTEVYVNQSLFLYFLCDPHLPAAVLHLGLASVGRLVLWPVLQRLNSAFNQSLKQRVPDAPYGSPAEFQQMDRNN